ncbi:hypothetical protein BMS3Abin02_01170 [bacterium BMS3Abin02]|nr:hypothetical protein BMS3Abin02_01170 [bacterium BMS3Abin02]
MTEYRRRIDIVLHPSYVEDLQSIDLAELRSRKKVADEVETELSYYRRLLHGRLDILAFELRRRAGEETRSLIEALPDVLGAGETTQGGPTRFPTVFAPDLPDTHRRHIDHVLGDDFLSRLPVIDDDELGDIRESLKEAEIDISSSRKAVQKVVDALRVELVRRYKDDAADLTIL